MSIPLELPTALTAVQLDAADGAAAEAMRRARAGAPEGTLVWVQQPSDPRGRLDRSWLEGSGGALHGALVLRPSLPAGVCAELAVAGVLAVARAVADVVEPVTELHYRWPNDLLLNWGKAAGVWLEGAGTPESLDWLVLAWAVNLGEPPESLGFEAAGIAREGRSEPAEPRPMLQAIARHLLAWIERWDEAGEFTPLRESWRGRLQLGETIRLALADGTWVEGIADDIDDAGALRIRTETGSRRITLQDFFGLPGAGA